MSAQIASPLFTIETLQKAMNQHDINAFVDCIDPGYQSEQPIHPNRAFSGNEQVRKNWTGIFNDIPDNQADLLRFAIDGDVAWTEWHWHGTRVDHTSFEMRGVIIMGVRNGCIVWGRLYMEPVER